MKKKYTYAILVLLFILSNLNCKKFLEIPGPTTSINQDNVYKNDNTAAGVLTGVYAQIMNEFFSGGITSISLIQELSADNLVLNNINQPGYLNWWRNSMNPDYFSTQGFNNYFSNFYPKIYIVNAAIEGLKDNSDITSSVKQRLLGEAFFLRALYYFYLVNLYGDVPMVLTTDYVQNAKISRSSVEVVYKQILADLDQSMALLDDRYLDANITHITAERVRPNLATAQALLSRVHIYLGNFSEAEKYASIVISKTNQYSLTNLESTFKKNSNETIWALQPVKQDFNTDEAYVFLLNDVPGTMGPKYFSLSSSLLENFEPNDRRLQEWVSKLSLRGIDYYYAAKYKSDANSGPVTEYCVVFRLAEQYLIRAEAKLEQNNLSGALNDLNTIRNRAGLPSYTSSNIIEIKNAILKERRAEFFTEWGHRWFDLKRSGTIDQAMSSAMMYKGGTWSSYKSLFPIPSKEMINNKNITQNPGY